MKTSRESGLDFNTHEEAGETAEENPPAVPEGDCPADPQDEQGPEVEVEHYPEELSIKAQAQVLGDHASETKLEPCLPERDPEQTNRPDQPEAAKGPVDRAVEADSCPECQAAKISQRPRPRLSRMKRVWSSSSVSSSEEDGIGGTHRSVSRTENTDSQRHSEAQTDDEGLSVKAITLKTLAAQFELQHVSHRSSLYLEYEGICTAQTKHVLPQHLLFTADKPTDQILTRTCD